jgi:hypothetical protein
MRREGQIVSLEFEEQSFWRSCRSRKLTAHPGTIKLIPSAVGDGTNPDMVTLDSLTSDRGNLRDRDTTLTGC